MLLALLLDDGSKLGYHVNPQNVVGAFYDFVSDGCYIDTTNGNQYQITKESYTSVVKWIDGLTEKR